MPLPDLTRREWAIAILTAFELLFFACTVAAYLWPHAPDDLRKFCAGCFGVVSSNLLLALKMGGPDNSSGKT